MNRIEITKPIDFGGPQKVELTLSPAIEKTLMSALVQRHPMEILQGERVERATGQIYYCFYLAPEDAQLLKVALLHVYTNISGYQTPS